MFNSRRCATVCCSSIYIYDHGELTKFARRRSSAGFLTIPVGGLLEYPLRAAPGGLF